MLMFSMFTKFQASALGLLTWLAAASDEPGDLVDTPDVQADEPNLNDVYIEGEPQLVGTGCPTGSAIVEVAPDKKSFLIGFSAMTLNNPNPAGATVQYKNCLASIKLHIPNGLQVSVATVNTRGYAFLDQGITARQTSSYTFAGYPIPTKVRGDLAGPFDDDFDYSDAVPFASRTWTQCGASAIFGINTKMQLNATANPTGTAIFNTEQVDGRFTIVYQVEFRPC